MNLAGREFTIRKQFLDDLASNHVLERVAALKKPVLVMHSPIDETVDVGNASKIFLAAKHPKSFVSLDKADHLVSGDEDADFAAGIISAWAEKYVAKIVPDAEMLEPGVTRVSETGDGKFQNTVHVGDHYMLADEPLSVGGMDSGPTPYGYLAAALGACTAMTMRIYADFKKFDVGQITVDISHNKIHAKDCEECTAETQSEGGKIDVFKRELHVEGLEDEELKQKLIEIADKCPVHKTLEKVAIVETDYR